MDVDFDLKLRLHMNEAADPSRPSVYFFNLYRSGSSLVEAIALAFARSVGLTPYNLSGNLYTIGVEYFDSLNMDQSSVHIGDPAQLKKLSDLGGYLYYGYREVPLGFAEVFDRISASVLVVRDPRDIGISQYFAVANHATDNRILDTQINALRKTTEGSALEEFILREDTLHFLNRIATCYGPMIKAGVPVLHYEDMYVDGALDLRLLCTRITDPLGACKPKGWDLDTFIAHTERLIANSKALKGHKTGGTVRNYEKLPEDVRAAYTEKLSEGLRLLGYL